MVILGGKDKQTHPLLLQPETHFVLDVSILSLKRNRNGYCPSLLPLTTHRGKPQGHLLWQVPKVTGWQRSFFLSTLRQPVEDHPFPPITPPNHRPSCFCLLHSHGDQVFSLASGKDLAPSRVNSISFLPGPRWLMSPRAQGCKRFWARAKG